jgi:hypothetical protein
MSHYTNSSFTLDELLKIDQQKEDFLDSLTIKLSDPALGIKDLALMLKSLEIMDNMEHLNAYRQFIINLANKSADFTTPNELVNNGDISIEYITSNIVQNPNFDSDALEVEIAKSSNFEVGTDIAMPWANGTTYKFDTLIAEGTNIISGISDGNGATAVWFNSTLKPNTQYKLSYDLVINDVGWDLPNGAKNMVDVLSEDEMVFSESGGGPDPITYVVSVVEDANMILPTCDGVIVPFDTSIPDYNNAFPAMELACTGSGGVWVEGNINDPLTQNHDIIPYNVVAREGDTLIFTNPSTNYLLHNAVSDDNISFTSPDMPPGSNWSWVVDGYHDIYFHCTFHPLEEGRLLTKTDHRYVYNIDHGLNKGDTVRMPINYGTMEELPSLSNSYFISLQMDNPCTSIGGVGSQTNIESLYHNLSIGDVVSFQSGPENVTDTSSSVDVTFSGGNATLEAQASVVIQNGIVTSIALEDNGTCSNTIYSDEATCVANSETWTPQLAVGAGYESAPLLFIAGGGGSGATAIATYDGRVVSTININYGGGGYTSQPTVQFTGGDPTTPATATANYDAATGQINSITITDSGVGYQTTPTITIVGGNPTTAALFECSISGSISAVTLTAGGSGYGSDGSVIFGEKAWETFEISAVVKGQEQVDIFLDDVNQMGHIHTVTMTTAQFDNVKLGNNEVIATNADNTGHSHDCTFTWDLTLNGGLGGIWLVGMTGNHTHGLDVYNEVSGGTKIELVNFGHYHEILITEAEEATLKAGLLIVTGDNPDGTTAHDGTGVVMTKTSDFGTSDPQHFHTVEFGCVDAVNDVYAITVIDQHIHDFGRVWYPGSFSFSISQWNDGSSSAGSNPAFIELPFADIPGYVKKEKGIYSINHGLVQGQRIHFQNIFNGIHHGNTNYWVESVIDADNVSVTETIIYPLAGAPGTTPTIHNVIEEYTVVADLASYRFQVERDITNHIGSAYVEGVQIEWSRPNTIESNLHGLVVGDVVQLPSGPQPYTPSELPGAMRDHTVIAIGDGYGPTEHMEIIVDTQTTITFADPNLSVVEGAQNSPWYWSWWDRTAASYAPYQRDEAVYQSFGDVTLYDSITGEKAGFELFRGGTYKFTNNAWNPSGHITQIDPSTGNLVPMYMHAAGIKAIPGAGWDNLVQAGMTHSACQDGVSGLDHYHCVSMRANHGLTIVSGDHNPFVNTTEEPGTWVGPEPFPVCMGLGGWCEELDVDGWYYNGIDDESVCSALNPTGDVGLAQWRGPQFIGNFSKEFTWTVPEDFGLTGADGVTGLGPFVAPGELNLAYHVESYQGLYKFDKSGMIEGTNPIINIYRGGVYRFRLNAPGHPFYITTDNGSNFTPGSYFGEYTNGVVGSRAVTGYGPNEGVTGQFGDDDVEVLEFTVPMDAPDTLYYQCEFHSSMIGTLNVIDLPIVDAGDEIVVYYHHGQDNMWTPLWIKDKIVVDNGSGPNFFQVQPIPENSFPVKGTQADVTGLGNLITGYGAGAIPKAQAMDIEFGSLSYLDPVALTAGIGQETFLTTTGLVGTSKFYISLDDTERSNIEMTNVLLQEAPWSENGSFEISAGQAFTTDAVVGGNIEQIVTGSVIDGDQYEVGYEIIEGFVDQFGGNSGTVQLSLIGDTTVTGNFNTDAGMYSETLIAPVNTTHMKLTASGAGKVDNVSLKQRVSGQNAWYLGDGWTVNTDGQAYCDGSVQGRTEINQTVNIQEGKLYEVKYTLANTDPEGDGSQGRLQLALGTNPYNLISNWNFDASGININWNSPGSAYTIDSANARLNFENSNADGITYTFTDNLNNIVDYEITMEVLSVTGTVHNFQVGPGPQANHYHTIDLQQSQYDFMIANEGSSLTLQQSDTTHAAYYTHTFSLAFDSTVETCTMQLGYSQDNMCFLNDGTPDPSNTTSTDCLSAGNTWIPTQPNYDYSCSFVDFDNLQNGITNQLTMTELTQDGGAGLPASDVHNIVLGFANGVLTVISDENDIAYDEITLLTADSGIIITSQTFLEGHDEIIKTGITTTNSDMTVSLGQGANMVTGPMVDSVGLHNFVLSGAIGNTITINTNGSGIIGSIKMKEVQVPVLDHHSTGVVNEGEKTYFIRAGGYDTKLHFIGDVDKRPVETDIPFYYSRGFKGSIDTVTVKEVNENWTFASEEGGSSYIDNDNGVIVTNGTDEAHRGIAHISFDVVEGDNYKLFLSVDRPTSSVIKVGPAPDNNQYGEMLIADSSNDSNPTAHRDMVFTAGATGVCYLTLATTGNGFTYWDQVSVRTIPNLSSDEYLLLGRALNVFGMPIGSESRWKQHNTDSENLDFNGRVVAGFRTLESFGENVIETYYDDVDEVIDNTPV